MRRAKIMVVFFVVLALSATNLCATPIEINITAQVAVVDDPCGLLNGQLSVDDIITGSYIYDSDTPDTDWVHGAASDTVGRYWHYSPPYGITLFVGGLIFQTDPADVEFLVEIVNDAEPLMEDGYNLRSYNNLPVYEGVAVSHIHWQLDDDSGSALSSDALPTMPPVLEDWSPFEFTIEGYGEDPKYKYTIWADVTSVELVPEPATVLLLGLGGLALLRKHNRKSKIKGTESPFCASY